MRTSSLARHDPPIGVLPQSMRCRKCLFNAYEENLSYLTGHCGGRSGNDNIKEYLDECNMDTHCGLFKQKGALK